MKASELIRKLQEIMEDYHCDPEVRVETSQENMGKHEIKIEHDHILDAQFIRGYCAFDKVILRKTKKFSQLREIIK